MLILIGAIATLGSVSIGDEITTPGVLSASTTAVAVDLVMRVVLLRRLEFPSGALLTGLVIALVLDPFAPPHVPATAAAVGIASKHVIRSGGVNVLNPAGVGLVAAHLAFGEGESWWGGLPDYGIVGLVLVLVPGAWIADHINKVPLMLSFLGAYFTLFTLVAVTGWGPDVAGMFRTPDVHMAIFFAFYMLDDPPTSPTRYVDQVWYGCLVALVAFALFMTTGIVYFLAAALLVGNIANGGRRWRQTRLRHTKTTSRAKPFTLEEHTILIPPG